MSRLPRLLSLARAAAIMTCLSIVPVAADAQEPPEAENPIVARVDGVAIHMSEVIEYAATLPPQYRQAFDQIYPYLVQRMIDLVLLDKAAEAKNLSEDEEVEARVAQLAVSIMREVYLERLIVAEVDEAAVEARYQTYLEENPPSEETHARHILVESEETAREIIAALDEGADFAELAMERSTGPSAPQGGDLGYFGASQMIPAFSDAAFSMEVGSYSKHPVQSEFGWHVILVEDRRSQAPPSFDEMAPELRQELQGAAVEAHLAGLREGADIEVVEPEPEPEPEGAEGAEEAAEESEDAEEVEGAEEAQ
jgi:peptidyl-prolyl cis-trans isomerase C